MKTRRYWGITDLPQRGAAAQHGIAVDRFAREIVAFEGISQRARGN
jgi:hypothetical protein